MARIISPPYGRYSTTLKENVSIFVLWMLGVGAAVVVMTAEKIVENPETLVQQRNREFKKSRFINRKKLAEHVARLIFEEDEQFVRQIVILSDFSE